MVAIQLSVPQRRPLTGAFAPARIRDALVRVRHWRPPEGRARKELAWQLFWLPFWFGSDVPAPRWPSRNPASPAAGPAGDHVVRNLNRLATRIWFLRAASLMVRALWLPLFAASVWLTFEMLGGPALRPDGIVVLGVLCVTVAAVLALLSRPTRRQVARMLDRSFELQDRMVTAVEHLGRQVPAPGERAHITYLQMADAANVVTEVRGHSAFAIRPPVRELVLGIAAGLLLTALLFLRSVGGATIPLNDSPVPKFVPAAERLAQEAAAQARAANAAVANPTVADINAQAARSAQAQRDLQTLAEALDGSAMTSEAAAAIQRGDYAAAADSLRHAAEQADQWSAQTRGELANELDRAASQIASTSPELANATQDAADGLRTGGQEAKSGVSNLGDAVEQTAKDVVPQSELAAARQQAEAASSGQSESGQDQAGQNGGDANQGGQSTGESENGGQSGGDNSSANSDASGDNSASSGNSDQASSQGQSQESQADGQSQSQSNAANGAGQPNGDASEGQPSDASSGGQPGDSSSDAASQASNEDTGSSGGGSEPGQSDSSDQASGGSAGAQSGQAQTEAGQPNVQDPNGNGNGAGQGTGESVDPHQAISLSGQSDNGVASSSESTGSSSGSGAGATVGSGATQQGAVGVAGPDSNRVPADYRSVVEAYFSDPTER